MPGGGGGRGGGRSGGRGGAPSPALLTANIRNATSLPELFRLVSASLPHLNHIHAGACWNALGLLAAAEPGGAAAALDAHAAALDALAARTAELLPAAGARELVNIVRGVHNTGRAAALAPLLSALARGVQAHVADLNPAALVNTVTLLSKCGAFDAPLAAAVARCVAADVASLGARDAAALATAFAKDLHQDEALLESLAAHAAQSVGRFNLLDLIDLSWALAKLGHRSPAFFGAAARAVAARGAGELGGLAAPQISQLVSSFARAGHADGALLGALARAAERQLGEVGPDDLASLLWVFANAGAPDARLFAAAAPAVERALAAGLLGEESIKNLEWAFGKAAPAGGAHAKLLSQLRKRRRPAAPAAAAAGVDVSGVGRIVVAGGGIGGAALGVALQRRGFRDVVVLEGDASFDARAQGYGLTIQGSAIQELGVSLARDDAPSTSHYTFDADGAILGFFGEAFGRATREEAADSGRFVHIPRQMLRWRLLEQLAPGTVRWGAKLASFAARPGGGGGVTVTLADGTTMDAALLVGADGIHSAVRRQLRLPGDRLNYCGLVVVLGIVPDAAAPTAAPLTRRRIFETVDGETRIYAMPFTTDSTMWQLSFPLPEADARSLCKDRGALKAEILRRCAGWHAPVPQLLGATPLDAFSGYPVYDREPLDAAALRAAARAAGGGAVTLMGDAAHPMTPFRAQGANQALADAVALAECLGEGVRAHGAATGVAAALPSFEARMLARSARVVAASRQKARELHSRLALTPARKMQRDAGGSATGADMEGVLAALRGAGVGAAAAADPRGLDAVVVDAIARLERGSLQPAAAAPPGKRRRVEQEEEEEGAEAAAAAAAAAAFKWRRALRGALRGAGDGGVRRKRVRAAVLAAFMEELAGRGVARDWWAARPDELRALFRERLLEARDAGKVRTEGKLVAWVDGR